MAHHLGSFQEVDPGTVARTISVLRVLARYHRHRVVGAEHIPSSGRCLVVVMKSFV